MAIGTVNQDVDGNYFVVADGKAYRVLLASITYFKVEPGDEVTLITPRDINSEWGAIENLLQKSREKEVPKNIGGFRKIDDIFNNKPEDQSPIEQTQASPESVIDEWMPNLDELRKELENNSNN